MIFKVTKASDWGYEGRVEIKTLEELMMFMEFYKEDVIIYRPNPNNYQDSYELKVYDNYVE